MILFETFRTESHTDYQLLQDENLERQLSFMDSMITTGLKTNQIFLSQTVIKALNFHTIACLHVNAGEYRPCNVSVGKYKAPEHYRVNALMDEFVNHVNKNWNEKDAVSIAALVLWKLNHIHPFINGNGRTARACCYFVLCMRLGGQLPGRPTLPELLKKHRSKYVEALKEADKFPAETPDIDQALQPIRSLIQELLTKQLNSTT